MYPLSTKETREKTADFLLTKPVTRTKIITSKLFAAFTSILITNIIYIIAATIMASLVKNDLYNYNIFFMISITLFFIQLIFLAIGFVVGVIFTKIKSVVSVSLGIVFLFFIFGMIAATEGKDVGRYFSPFKYFNLSYIRENASYEAPFLFAGIVIVIVSFVTSFYLFKKKDIHTV